VKRDTCIECGINIRDSESRYRCAACRTHAKIWNNGFSPDYKKSDMVIVKDGKYIKGKIMPCSPGRRYRGGVSPYAEKWEKSKNAQGRTEDKKVLVSGTGEDG
jgi:hypothetical protein